MTCFFLSIVVTGRVGVRFQPFSPSQVLSFLLDRTHPTPPFAFSSSLSPILFPSS